MKLLLDANISYRIVKPLELVFKEVIHVEKVLGEMATDKDIWNYALKNDFIIITNDIDFINFLNFNGFPPKIILLKTGNQSNNYINSLLISKYDIILEFYNNSEFGLLEIL